MSSKFSNKKQLVDTSSLRSMSFVFNQLHFACIRHLTRRAIITQFLSEVGNDGYSSSKTRKGGREEKG